MKISEQWLREWANPAITTQELAARLTMAGLEVSSILPVSTPVTGIVVGQIQAVNPHPNADKLTVCTVDVGTEILTIVCGASNVKPGIKVPVATIGAELSSDFVIKKTKLRGVESQGMMCSAKELGLAEESQGLLVLPESAPIGEDLNTYLNLKDTILEIELTPNRADCLSVAGVAREVAVINECAFVQLPISAAAVESNKEITINISAQQACPSYMGRVITGIAPGIETPLWLKERLRRSGIKNINPIVDVTNYVMLELGQPLHAFDLEKIPTSLEVRFAHPQEKITLLNGDTVELQTANLVIAGKDEVLAVAGVMGGLASSVNENTSSIFLESAYFDPVVSANNARSLGIRSESSHRFERGVDPQLQEKAIERATNLILEIVGGKTGPITKIISESHHPNQISIRLRKKRIKKILGIDIADEFIVKILTGLGMEVKDYVESPLEEFMEEYVTEKIFNTWQGQPTRESSNQESSTMWQVTVPSYRVDLKIEPDLIEELARIYGYASIPATMPNFIAKVPASSERRTSYEEFRRLLKARDYHEVITYSFVDPKLQELLDPLQAAYLLANPIAADKAAMRTSLWPGLISTYLYNTARQQNRLRFFELGLRFILDNGKEVKQEPVIAGLASGTVLSEQWGASSRPIDFFDIKSDVEALLKPLLSLGACQFLPTEHPSLHPAKSASIVWQGQAIGVIGVLHPKIAQKMSITQPVVLFELLLDKIQARNLPCFTSLSKFPSIRRDLAILVDKSIPVAEIIQLIQQVGVEWLVRVELFDLYQGERIAQGQKSLAFAFILQHSARTLLDEEVNALMTEIITKLQQQFGAILRE